ncbi:MAG: hypothetical protein HOW97_22525 [Catenulispora sp.]|nr:hypothetical protein [Catenulispora sp.]
MDAEGFADSLTAFAGELTAFRIDHGNPTLEDIERHAPAGRVLSRSGVSEVLNGKRLPSLDFLIDLIRTILKLEDERGREVSRNDERLQGWRSRWQDLKKQQTNERRGTAKGPLGPAEPTPWAHLPERAPAPPRRLRIFVAMPARTMGEHAKWDDIAEIREQLLEPVAARIGEQLSCDVDLVIEKDKRIAGAILRPMFAEAALADVYIADLTGASPNVYLELGARWALRDNVTILICQDTGEIRFNAVDGRAIEYGWKPKELSEAIHRIADAALHGLRNPGHVDSLVRDAADQILISRTEYDALRGELDELRQRQAEDLIEAALRTTDLRRRIEILEQATAGHPTSWRAFYELGAARRRAGDYARAVTALSTAVELKDDSAAAWRELGIALGKAGTRDEDAVLAFDRALALDGGDAETWATQGGLFRRLARRRAPGSLDASTLERALACYQRANAIAPKKLYSMMNAARIRLLLAALYGTDLGPALAEIKNLELLARYEAVSDREGEPWARLDLADALVLSGRAPEALAELRTAADLIAAASRGDMLTTESETLTDFLTVAAAFEPVVVDALALALDACAELSGLSA